MHIPHSSTMQRAFSVSMTPMIDVVFLLLIFFVCTANFQIPEAILPTPLKLTGASAVSLPPKFTEVELERVLITVSQGEKKLLLSINGQNCSTLTRLADLLVALAGVDDTLPVLLDIEDETPLGSSIDVYDQCRLAGFKQIQFVVEAAK